jgi:3-phosphoshikimate 1-carboxyvinyltransferase
MGRVTEPLALFGATARGRRGGRLPLTLTGAANPMPVQYATPVPSAQVKSAILLAGLNAPGQTVVIELAPTRDHTERMLRAFGAEVATEVTDEGHVITLTGQPELQAQAVTVPRDPSSAAFPVAAALMVPGSVVTVPGVGLNPGRAGFYDTLAEMGAALAAVAEGPTAMRGIGELRVKESDRLDAMARGLQACGVRVEEGPDRLVVHGKGPGGVAGGATVASRLDHRIAMAFACLGLAAKAPIEVDDAGPIATSFPGFAELMRGLGVEIGP